MISNKTENGVWSPKHGGDDRARLLVHFKADDAATWICSFVLLGREGV